MWYTIKNFSVDSDQAIAAEAQVQADCVWFDGHFPGEPILPGVAQLTLVVDLLQKALKQPIVVEGVSRVRFKQMIRPKDDIRVHIAPSAKGVATFGFRLSKGKELACSGSIKIAQP